MANVQQAVGKVVLFRRVDGTTEIGELTGVIPNGGVLLFKQGDPVLMNNIETLKPIGPDEAGQIFVDRNATAGGEHSRAALYPSAGWLAGMFPNRFADEHEAVSFMLELQPSSELPEP
ncbi:MULTISPECIES: hypothetical protein [unclassified Corallococcus]|uniref:hypothetical protein n=1 Tax=unclassified Corallococcus TaxID=2685029 RepID=UPI001A8FBDDF|nr:MULTISPECIES: hypothetical protein [unclassified Corallococcus]MBN9687371.1 hypothetical protein [Corallococcus sp. NCSPR001]WAS88807.1 hypothetical protein O0N60_17890 [Corallococcus sp. NCRR]